MQLCQKLRQEQSFERPRINLNRSRIKKDYKTNAELLKRYDGFRADLGVTVEQVDALYGKPLRLMPVKGGQTARIYGDRRELQVNPAYSFSCVAVVFDSQGRATNIYSHGFFNDEWIKTKESTP